MPNNPTSAASAEQEPTKPLFHIELPLTIRLLTGTDQRKLPESRLQMQAGVEYLFIAERLFWTVRQLSLMKEHLGHVYSEEQFFEALESIGDIGQAVVLEASDRVQKLEHICDSLSDRKEK